MNNLDKKYQGLIQELLDSDCSKIDYNENKTLSIFGKQLIHDMSEGFPLLTVKEVIFKNIVIELLWYLKGDTSVKFLLDNNFNLYNHNLYKKFLDDQVESYVQNISDEDYFSYEKFVSSLENDEKFLELHGNFISTFGKQLRQWTIYEDFINITHNKGIQNIESGTRKNSIDQLFEVVKKIRINPEDKSIFVNSWNVAEINNMILPLNIHSFQIFTKKLNLNERLNIFLKENKLDNLEIANEEFLDNRNVPDKEISLMWNQINTDIFSELPKNLAIFGLLLNIFSILSGMIPGKLIVNLGEAFLREENIEQAKKELELEPYDLCNLNIDSDFWEQPNDKDENIDDFINSIKVEHFSEINYSFHY